jgi:hypothetical protein
MRLARSATFWWTGDGGWGGPPRPYLSQQYLKGMSHEMDFKKFEKKLTELGLIMGRCWFFNFLEAPLVFK